MRELTAPYPGRRNRTASAQELWVWPILVSLLSPVVCHAEPESAANAATLISEARSFDGMYCGLQQEDREKATALYESALRAQPDKTQTLEILFRLAQLHGTNYQISKDEKPRYGQAMRLYQRIVSEYPHDTPLAMKSLVCIGDIYATEWRFADALHWYNRALEVNMDALLQEQQALADDPDRRAQCEQIVGRIERLWFYQSSAVRAISYAAMHIDPSVRNGLLESIISRHQEAHIRKAVAAELAQRGKLELFPLPAHLEDMTPYDESALVAKELSPNGLFATPVPAAVPPVVAAPEALASYRAMAVIAAIALVTMTGASISFARRIRTQLRRKAS